MSEIKTAQKAPLIFVSSETLDTKTAEVIFNSINLKATSTPCDSLGHHLPTIEIAKAKDRDQALVTSPLKVDDGSVNKSIFVTAIAATAHDADLAFHGNGIKRNFKPATATIMTQIHRWQNTDTGEIVEVKKLVVTDIRYSSNVKTADTEHKTKESSVDAFFNNL